MAHANLKLVVVAVFCLVVGLSAPAVGHGVQHALYAHNADKVDGRHAVGAATGPANRAGKLVATNGSGMLPSNIVAPPVAGWELIQTESDFDSGAHKVAAASCTAGKRVVGGGVQVFASGGDPDRDLAPLSIRGDGPSSESTWFAIVDETAAYGHGWKVIVYAICVK